MNEDKKPEAVEEELIYKYFRPDNLIFMGRNITVSFIEEGPWGSDVYGDFYAREQRIRILDGLTPVEELDTVIHEVIHMVMNYMGIMMGQVDEEMITHRMASGLTAVLVENPHVAEYISAISAASTHQITKD
jgi:hypothetical protein